MLPQALSSVAYSSVTSSYTTLATLSYPTRIVKIINTTNATILISWNGDATTDNDVLPPNSFFLYDITTNQSHYDGGEFIAAQTVFSIKYRGSAPTGSGSVYLSALYAQET